jgi:pimeloyl-ACP methyl ester carboxylesterase
MSGFDPRFRYRQVETNGIVLRAVEAGTGPAVIFLHGLPTCWYTFRRQLPLVAEAGYRGIAVDLRGFGRSSCPLEISAYDALHFAGDWLGLLDDIGAEQAVFVGHDMGGFHVWDFVQLHPDRVAAVMALAVPLIRLPEPITEINRKRFKDGRFMHVLFHNEYGPPEERFENFDTLSELKVRLLESYARLDAGPGRTGGLARREWSDGDSRGSLPDVAAVERPSWLSEEDLDYYATVYRRTNYTGAMNFYRNFDRNWEILRPYHETKVDVPAVYMAGEYDMVIYPRRTRAFVDQMDEWLPQLFHKEIIEGAGHFIQEERPDRVNEVLLSLLASVSYGSADRNVRPSLTPYP